MRVTIQYKSYHRRAQNFWGAVGLTLRLYITYVILKN